MPKRDRKLWGAFYLWVITPAELEDLKDGTRLVSIDGEIVIKGQDRIDPDTRFGMLAYGFLEPAPL